MNSLAKQSISTGAVVAAIAVALGAFGAHVLRPKLDTDAFTIFETAVRYQMYHALALILFGLATEFKSYPKIIYTLFLVGIIIFCCTLYGIVLGSLMETNPLKWLGAITPLGGIAFITAWVLFAFNSMKK